MAARIGHSALTWKISGHDDERFRSASVWPMRAWTVVLVGAASLSAAYMLVLLGVDIWENIVDESGTAWVAALWFAVALFIPVSGVIAHRVGKRRGETGGALVRRVAFAVLGVAWAIAALLVIAAAPL